MKREQMRKYWRSREELHQTPSFIEASEHEFADELDISSPEPEGTSRRGFLGWVGASLAASGLSGCIRRPEEKILPYSVAAEEILPGIPQYYASATHLGGEVVGVASYFQVWCARVGGFTLLSPLSLLPLYR